MSEAEVSLLHDIPQRYDFQYENEFKTEERRFMQSNNKLENDFDNIIPDDSSPCHGNKLQEYDDLQFAPNTFQAVGETTPLNVMAIPAGWPLPVGLMLPLESRSKIGTLSPEERSRKIEIFRAKKKDRVFKKRIKYECRQKVAEARIRVKGRFFSKKEAITIIKDIGYDASAINETKTVNELLNSNMSIVNSRKKSKKRCL